MRASEMQVGGSHYKDMAIQPVDFIVANGVPFLEANVIKYVCRHLSKGGVEDIRKARHYLDLVLEKVYGVSETQPVRASVDQATPAEWDDLIQGVGCRSCDD